MEIGLPSTRVGQPEAGLSTIFAIRNTVEHRCDESASCQMVCFSEYPCAAFAPKSSSPFESELVYSSSSGIRKL